MELPKEIWDELNSSSQNELQSNYKRFIRDTQSYVAGDWTRPQLSTNRSWQTLKDTKWRQNKSSQVDTTTQTNSGLWADQQPRYWKVLVPTWNPETKKHSSKLWKRLDSYPSSALLQAKKLTERQKNLPQASTSHQSPEASKTPDLPDATTHHSPPMKKFVIFNTAAYLTSPNKPKIQYVDREQMRDWCDIAMESLMGSETDINEEVIEEYKRCSDDQKNLTLFSSFPGVSDFLNDVLKAGKEDFSEMLWEHEKRLEATGTTCTFMNIVCYTLTDFHSNCKQLTRNNNNHECTTFGLETYGMANLENNNYVASYSDRKYADALGKNAVTDNEEFFIESSSGFEKENVSHSLDDPLKLLAECSSALLHIIKHNKKAGIDTIIKKCTLGVQTGKWRFIEVRSSCTPTCWELRSHRKPLFEMMATIYLELLEQRSLDKIIMEEVCGLRVLPSQSVADHFLNTNV
ncbi:hypothetical protein G6F57_000333 [Rhizopus arrhizus]|uniref:Uncharacterized protein n=1 Tax=Rhizopus oryzae TaxID=64495 RepID=A0A9P6XL03_RHIOR|nr:hypothetical protein G6F24_000323 [Rhizopus arrhizus]KAG0797664.1 hypothetical protein G6F21_000341 [Rhizopus arrhizus]KAG0819594.1 hypothetical protein G6F20_000644 [Rhizopus arrhizus]KAG0843373.1 hypothetical protein G6F19_000522 [Rhizopus arrhizus]KAG0845665.1 hypothetical protein G6F18_000760 [Rhizopus arrhizus]